MSTPARTPATGAPDAVPAPRIGDLVDCPDCGLPAEIVDTFSLPSTSGPVPHVRTSCVQRQHFMIPADRLT